MIAIREFQTVEEMLAFQKNLKARLYSKPPPPRMAPPVRAGGPVARMRVPTLAEVAHLAPNHDSHVKLWKQCRPAKNSAARSLLEAVAYQYGLTAEHLTGPDRYQYIVIARSDLCWRLRYELKLSLGTIGNFFNRDHTTILHNINRHIRRLDSENPDTLTFTIRNKGYALKIHEMAEILRLNRGHRTAAQIGAELRIPLPAVNWAIGAILGERCRAAPRSDR